MSTSSSGENFSPIAVNSFQSLKSIGRDISPATTGADSSLRRIGAQRLYPALRAVEPLDGLQALRHAAEQAALRRSVLTPLQWKTDQRRTEDLHAEPLSPLRERDIHALSDWFDRDDIWEIETDVAHCLLLLLPEPCWEEDPSEFLKEFL